MSEQPEGTMRDIADDGSQENASSATDGGRSSRGPSLSTAGEQEMGGAVPPYEGRQESAPVDDSGAYQDGAHVGGATGPVSSDSDDHSGHDHTGDDTTEQAHYEADPGVGPAHTEGTGRAEDQA